MSWRSLLVVAGLAYLTGMGIFSLAALLGHIPLPLLVFGLASVMYWAVVWLMIVLFGEA